MVSLPSRPDGPRLPTGSSVRATEGELDPEADPVQPAFSVAEALRNTAFAILTGAPRLGAWMHMRGARREERSHASLGTPGVNAALATRPRRHQLGVRAMTTGPRQCRARRPTPRPKAAAPAARRDRRT